MVSNRSEYFLPIAPKGHDRRVLVTSRRKQNTRSRGPLQWWGVEQASECLCFISCTDPVSLASFCYTAATQNVSHLLNVNVSSSSPSS
ncbi:hypothetical protein J6590_036580 [Homalodisca vitripennis]|nr:hypothetical protein J6590_036580 [Homalodisca vitripennis]